MAKVMVELTFPSDLKDEPVIYQMGRDFKVIPNIIEASFSTEMGWAILSMEGEETEVERLFEFLRSKNIEIRRR